MVRASTKHDLLVSAQERYEEMIRLIRQMEGRELAVPFDFSGDAGKKEAHWQRDRNLRDVVIHLYEWHQLLLRWVSSNLGGQPAAFLPPPYNWKTYGEMNKAFWAQHQTTPLSAALEMLQSSHEKVVVLAESLTEAQLFSKGGVSWSGSSTLGSYFVSATASHYDWAIKKLKAHKKRLLTLP